MSNPKAQEPSMEEILASIRRIISEDGASQPKEDAVPGSTPAENSNSATKANVLELTDVVSENGSVTTLDKETPAPAAENTTLEAAKPRVASGETLLSKETAAASFGSLAELASAVARHEMSHADVSLGPSTRTIEGFIAELLRPMLREWLDNNLPGIIDRMVRREIERLVRRAEDQ